MLRRACLALAIVLCGMFVPAFAQEKAETPAKSRFDTLIEKKKKFEGMWTVYLSDQQLLVDLSTAAQRKEYIIIPSISRGISQGMVLGGMSISFGDDVIWAFRVTEDKLFIIQRNVRFKAKANSPEAAAVDLAYSDSVLYSLPVLTKSPSGGILVDMTQVFMNDELQIGTEIGPGFRFANDRSTFGTVKAFSENIELGVNAVYQGTVTLDTVPNSRGAQVGIHYSLSVLPSAGSNGYKTRIADDRVGYFVTALKDFSNMEEPDHFLRYITRWNLQKLESGIDLSPPKEPIRFYIENTVPVYLRPTVEAAILDWNKAFEKLGFAGAIKVDQQPADPDFDPENIHYNTFRWMTAEAGFAMGPSRVDPRTGQILDADIIMDAQFLDSWSERWESMRGDDALRLLPNWSPRENPLSASPLSQLRHQAQCTICQDMQQHTGFAAAVFMATGASMDGALPKEFIHEGLKEVVMHEVGHTLGLRHNFKASSWKTLKEIKDADASRKDGIIASVMDYAPPFINEDKGAQGLYYAQTIGPYDYWAIEYGYKLISSKEEEELKKIAARSGEPALRYTTDEDTRSIDSDPFSNRFDMGKDPLEYVRYQMNLSGKLLPQVVDRTVKDGEGYQRARQAYGLLFREYWRAVGFAARFPGGIEVSRGHKGDKDAPQPFTVVDSKLQREAMQLLADSAFAAPEVSPKQMNYLAASRWSHWGVNEPARLDYPVHDDILTLQDQVLGQVLQSMTLNRILDNEFKAADQENVYTLAEHMRLLVDSIFAEWKQAPEAKEFKNAAPLIASFRRNLQRSAITRLSILVAQSTAAPSDARTLTRMHLKDLRANAQKLLDNGELKLDDYTRAHLADSVARLDAILNADYRLPSLN